MSRSSSLVWLVLLPIVVHVLGNQANSSREDEYDNFTTRVNEDFTTRYDKDSAQHDYYNNYTKNLYEEDRKQNMSAELRDNHRKTDYKGNLTISYKFRPKNDSNKDNLNKMCNNTICIPICYKHNYRLFRGICILDAVDHSFPEIYNVNKKVNDIFQSNMSCEITGDLPLFFKVYRDDEYMILINGSVYHRDQNIILDPTTYCFAVITNKYELINIKNAKLDVVPVGLIVSLPFLLLTFMVYTILKELWNLHGYILRGYIAFITQFWFSASFFWLNVMCFDIWWRFGQVRPFQGSMTREDRRRFIIYSIYAWGCASILIIICAIMDFVPSVPENFIKPQLGKIGCWLTEESDGIYFYGPISVTIVCNICMFISTTLKFKRNNRNIESIMQSTESRRHDDNNKQTFILYVKLFILMGITWSMEIISWIFKSAPEYTWDFSDLINSLYGLMIFIIFVCKDNIKKLLLKKFRQNCTFSLFSRNTSRSGCNTILPTSKAIPLNKISPCVQMNCRAENLSD
ncbi:G-protein coupled receptor Mth2-like [Odontomachus brunneus]|uniref:G-protein coupled receptor Mth2-like n=1 Tax=Odontomachus brunneus TaxID=486640 RepID=UPI0013F2ABCA|nr:G-protein coupled receptor Mth2-like [Odontomachus brunneus]